MMENGRRRSRGRSESRNVQFGAFDVKGQEGHLGEVCLHHELAQRGARHSHTRALDASPLGLMGS